VRYYTTKGNSGSIPRNFIYQNLPFCPFCNKRTIWEYGMKFGLINRYHFRCGYASCRIVLSIRVVDISPPLLFFVNWTSLLMRTTHKLMMVESPGNNQKAIKYIGIKYPLTQFQKMSLPPPPPPS